MDLQYLLFLQGLRESTYNVLTPFFFFMTKTVEAPVWMFLIALIYWTFSKSIGGWMVMNSALCSWFNGIAKLTACVYRPWIRDAAITPAGDAIKTATGYSFPSGHSTRAAIYYGSFAVLAHKHKKFLLTAMFILLGLLVMLSRNYLGVHTPQDVVFGFGISLLIIIGNMKLFKWMQQGDSTRDIKVLVFGLIIIALSGLYIMYKPYPIDYVDGKLLVDPVKMSADGLVSVGVMAITLIAWFIEKQFIGFENPSDKTKGIIISIVAFIPMILWCMYFSAIAKPVLGKVITNILFYGMINFYIFVVVPLAIQKLSSSRKF